jgi:hypothetical protein
MYNEFAEIGWDFFLEEFIDIAKNSLTLGRSLASDSSFSRFFSVADKPDIYTKSWCLSLISLDKSPFLLHIYVDSDHVDRVHANV